MRAWPRGANDPWRHPPWRRRLDRVGRCLFWGVGRCPLPRMEKKRRLSFSRELPPFPFPARPVWILLYGANFASSVSGLFFPVGRSVGGAPLQPQGDVELCAASCSPATCPPLGHALSLSPPPKSHASRTPHKPGGSGFRVHARRPRSLPWRPFGVAQVLNSCAPNPFGVAYEQPVWAPVSSSLGGEKCP